MISPNSFWHYRLYKTRFISYFFNTIRRQKYQWFYALRVFYSILWTDVPANGMTHQNEVSIVILLNPRMNIIHKIVYNLFRSTTILKVLRTTRCSHPHQVNSRHFKTQPQMFYHLIKNNSRSAKTMDHKNFRRRGHIRQRADRAHELVWFTTLKTWMWRNGQFLVATQFYLSISNLLKSSDLSPNLPFQLTIWYLMHIASIDFNIKNLIFIVLKPNTSEQIVLLLDQIIVRNASPLCPNFSNPPFNFSTNPSFPFLTLPTNRFPLLINRLICHF